MALQLDVFRSAGSTIPLRVQLKSNDAGIDLTGATVLFYLMDTQYYHGENFGLPYTGTQTGPATKKVDGATCAADADTTNYPVASGWIVWSPTAANVDTPGNYHFAYKVTYASGKIEMFPEEMPDYIMRLGPSLALL